MKKTIKYDPVAIATLYDDIAAIYADYYEDYNEAIRKQGADLAKVIQTQGIYNNAKILDCSCGIGTQAIGLALEGFNVSGCDISPGSIKKAEENAKSKFVDIPFKTVDMRFLSKIYNERFSVVLSCGNSIAHLLTDEDLKFFFESVKKTIEPGGIFLVALTDHEKNIREEGVFYDPHVKEADDFRTVNFQLWKWIVKGLVYICDDYTVLDYGKNQKIKKVSATFRIWHKKVLFSKAEEYGFSNCQWLLPQETGHHNPIFIAQAI